MWNSLALLVEGDRETLESRMAESALPAHPTGLVRRSRARRDGRWETRTRIRIRIDRGLVRRAHIRQRLVVVRECLAAHDAFLAELLRDFGGCVFEVVCAHDLEGLTNNWELPEWLTDWCVDHGVEVRIVLHPAIP